MMIRTLVAVCALASTAAFAAEPVNSTKKAALLTKGEIATIGLGVVAVGTGIAIATNDSDGNGGGTSGTSGTTGTTSN